MSEKVAISLLDSVLLSTPKKRPTLCNSDALDDLLSRSTYKELDSFRSYIGKQVSSGVYDSKKAPEILRKLHDYSQTTLDTSRLNSSRLNSSRQNTSRLNTSRQSRTPDRSPDKLSRFIPDELTESPTPSELAASFSLAKTLQFAVIRAVLFAFRNIEDYSVGRKANEEMRRAVVGKTQNKHELIGLRLKGRILVAIFKKQSRLNIHSAFYRWKVKADPLLVKDVVDQFALYTRISFTSAFWRMKSVLHAKRKIEAQLKRSEKQRRAGRILEAIFSKKLMRHYKYAYHQIKDYSYKRKLLLKILNSCCLYQRMDLRKFFVAWRFASGDKALEIRRKKLIKVFSKGRDLLRIAFEKWRSRGAFKQLRYEAKQGLGGQLMEDCLDHLLMKRLREAFAAIKSKREEYKRLERSRERFKEAENYAFTLLNMIFINNQKMKTQIGFSFIKEASYQNRYAKTKVMQKLIFRNESRIREVLRHWKAVCDVGSIIKLNKNIRTLFSVLNYSVRNSMHPLLQIETENKKHGAVRNILYATRNRLQEAFTRWQANSSVNHITTEYFRFRNSTFLGSVLSKLVNKRYQRSLQMIRKFVEGNESNKVKAAARLFIYNVESLKHYFQVWAANSRRLTSQIKAIRVQKAFNLLRELQRDNALAIFAASKEQKKKRSILSLLVCQLENLKKNAFYIWAARIHQGKIHWEMNWRKRLQMADVLALRLGFMYRNRLKDAFGKIMTQSKQNKQMIRALLAMQRAVFDQKRAAFMTWQNYKNNLRHEQRRKLAFMLRDFSERNLRHAFQRLKDELRHKQYIMRKTISKLEISNTSNTKFYFYKWIKATETLRALERFQATVRIFEIAAESFKPLLSVIVNVQHLKKEKLKIFKKLLLATNIRLKDAIRLWHSKSKALSLSNKLREEMKTKLLGRMKLLHANFSTEAMRYYMRKWKDACKEHRLKKRILSKFLHSNLGLMNMAFNRWKTKASNKYMNKVGAAHRMELFIKHLRRKNLQTGFSRLAEKLHLAMNMKVNAIKRLVVINQGELKRCFRTWAENAKKIKQMEACRATIVLLGTINEVLRNQTESWLVVDPVERMEKEKIMRLILGNMESNLFDAFRIWKLFARQSKAEEAKFLENVKKLVGTLNLIDRRWNKSSLKEAFENLKYHMNIQRQKKRLLIRVLKTTFGLLQDSFSRWKSLPKPENLKQKAAIGTCSYHLEKLYNKAIKSGFDAIKNIWHEKNEKKRACIQRLIYITQSNQKRLFSQWKAATTLLRNGEMCKKTLKLFELLRFTFASNVISVIEPDSQKVIKIRALNKLKDETLLLMRVSLHTWREAVWKLKYEQKSRHQKYLGGIIRLSKWIETKRLAEVKVAYGSLIAHKLYMNNAKKVILAIYKTKIGQMLSAFQKWKSIPGPDKNVLKASTFALTKVLDSICQRVLRDSFEKIKDEWIQDNEAKKGAIRKLIWVTTDRMRHTFDMWARYSKTAKSMQYYKACQRIFDCSARVLEMSIKDLRKGIIMGPAKITATTKIVKYFVGLNLRPWFQRWHLVSKIHISKSKVRIPNLVRNIDRIRLRALKEAFEKFRTRNETLKLRRFIGIFTKYEVLYKKEAIEAIKHHYHLLMQKKKLFAANNIIRYHRLLSQSSLFNFFSAWRQWAKNYNPWFKRSAHLLAKNCRINPQVAFWRLKDSLRIKGAHLNKHKMEKTNKLFLVLKKKYEQTLAKAFWQIESLGKMHISIVKAASLNTSMESAGLLNGKFEKQKQLILKLLVRNYTLQVQNTQERLKEYFGRWVLQTKKSHCESLNANMDEDALVHFARLGAIELMRKKLENVVLRMKSDAFSLICKHME